MGGKQPDSKGTGAPPSPREELPETVAPQGVVGSPAPDGGSRPGPRTRFHEALGRLRIADMATLAPPNEGAGASPNTQDGEEKYQIGAELGRGGMGIVRRTRDAHLDRSVAMKTLIAGPTADPHLAGMLVREAQLTGQLEHPNIIPIYDLGMLSNGEFFYTMRLQRELTLATILDGLRAGAEEFVQEYHEYRLLQIFHQICMAMAFAHARGVIHRDLKPGNIIVGDYGEVQVTDWGVADVLPDAKVTVPCLRADLPGGEDQEPGEGSGLVGTPEYMSPEQAKGRADLGPASDIYTLGVLLYELLTLRLPYENTTDLPSLLASVAAADIVEPEALHPNRVINSELVAICRRALARSPEDRFLSARELGDAVAAYVEGSQRRRRRAERAEAEVQLGKRAAERYFELVDEQDRRSTEIEARTAQLKPWHPMSERKKVSVLRDERDRIALSLGLAFSEASQRYFGAMVHEPDNAEARTALAELYWSKLLPAIEREDFQDVAYYGGLVRQLSDPRNGPLRDGFGTVSLRSLPEGATVWLKDVTSFDPASSEGLGAPLGTTPLMELTVQSGVYIVVARTDGYRESRRPMLVRPGDHVHELLSLTPLAEDRPIVGRDGELGRLRALFASTSANGRPSFCVVTGAPGMGKSSLLDTFEDGYLEDIPETVWFYYAEPRRTHPLLPFAPLAELFAFRAGLKHGESTDARRRKVAEMTRLAFSERGQRALTSHERLLVEETTEDLCLLPGLLDPYDEAKATASRRAGLAPDEVRRRIFGGVTRYFERLGRSAPIYIGIRWLERLDDSTLEVLRHMHERLRSTPLFVLASCAQERLEPGARESTFDHEISLSPLDELAVERFVADSLEARVTASLVDALHRVSRGRPDHLAILLPLLAGTRQIVDTGSGQWTLDAPLGADDPRLTFGASLERLVFTDLGPREQVFLGRAAVAGRVFAKEELLALGVEDADQSAAILQEAGIIRTRPTVGLLWTEIYAFTNPTLRDIAYERVSVDERRDLHLRLAATLAGRSRRSAEATALMADHFRNAGDLNRAREELRRLAAHARAYAAVEEEALILRQEAELALRDRAI